MTAIDPHRALAARIAARAQIRDVVLTTGGFEVMAAMNDDAVGLSYDMSVDPTGQWDGSSTMFMVGCDYSLLLKQRTPSPRVVDENEEPSEEASELTIIEAEFASLTFTYVATFSLDIRDDDEPFTEEEVSAYAATTGTFALHPFVREYVRDVTGRMGVPPLVLGVAMLPVAKDAVATATGPGAD